MTKRLLNLLTALIMTVSLAGVLPAVMAGALTYGDYNYDILDDGTVEITNYNGTATSIEIPSTIDGKPVTSIGYLAFYRKQLTSAIIPNSVKSIGETAFEYCSNLTSVTIGNNVISIGSSAFDYCTSLIDITIPNSVKSIENSTFSNCESLTSVIIGSNVASIGFGAFFNCESLTSIIIPKNVISINDLAFYGCNKLTIKCYNGSYAQKYAVGNKINYILLDKVAITKPAKVKSVKLTAKKKKLNVKWKKISGATGYEVMYAKNNKFTKVKKTVKVKKNKVTLKRLKSKKKYFVKVRAYKKANGSTSYGKWSKTVKVKVK